LVFGCGFEERSKALLRRDEYQNCAEAIAEFFYVQGLLAFGGGSIAAWLTNYALERTQL
jgi:hypothetical protein